MKGSNITIKDMAKKLNVSVSTVSRALRDVPDINAETKRKIRELAESLDYQPNQVALSLVKSRTKTIGVVVPNIGYSFFASVLQGIEFEASKAGYSLLISQSNELLEKEKANIQNLHRSQVEGFIISLANTMDNDEHIQKLIRKEVPLVVFDRFSEQLICNKVIIDNREASKNAVQHLIENGCKRVAMLAGPANLHITEERVKGYKDAIEQAGQKFDRKYVTHCDLTLKNVLGTIEEFWKGLPERPDGIFAVTDRIAIAAIHTLKSIGLRVPDDVTVIGFNDDPFGAMFTPALSSVSQPSFEIGQEVVKLLLEQINRPEQDEMKYQTKVLPTRVVVRESSVKKK
jgi:LacI family transcriptional regulator, repressor for deo operon, udp, cdd, tsx, nupC, and nupG